MRRSFLILTVLSISAWAQQPAQRQAQTLPPVVKVEMPPSNPPNFWMQAIYVAVPALIGAVSAWIGVWLTSGSNRKQWDRQTRLSTMQKHYETVVSAVQKEGRLYDQCWEALRTSNSVANETLQAINEVQQEGLNATTVAALYMSDTLFKVHSQLTAAAARFRKAITEPHNSPAAGQFFGEYSILFATFINTAREELGHKEKLTIINRYAAGASPK
jgi:hypothetical protein